MKLIFFVLIIIIGCCIAYVAGVILLAQITDYKPQPQEKVPFSNPLSNTLTNKDTFSCLIWNIGYGGLGDQSDFFYDGGSQVRSPKEMVNKYQSGIIKTLETKAKELDFVLLQEVDRDSKRSYFTDEADMINKALPNHAFSFAPNYLVRFVPIPFFTPLGKVKSGLCSFSLYEPKESVRYAFEGNYHWPNNLFFLDRCFHLMRFPLANNKELCIINTHNSAYDDGSLKALQLEQLQKVMLHEYRQGNYIVVGGDWNQYPPNFSGFSDFPVDKEETHKFVPEEYPEKGWQWVYDSEVPTNRSLARPLDDQSFRSILDFYLVSPNINVLAVEGIPLNFAYSDHQAIKLQFALN